eukprot:SAG31_NODE_99_length_25388_cov_12.710507_10_plen_78_part_00
MLVGDAGTVGVRTSAAPPCARPRASCDLSHHSCVQRPYSYITAMYVYVAYHVRVEGSVPSEYRNSRFLKYIGVGDIF